MSILGSVDGSSPGRFYLVGEGDAVVGNVVLDDGRGFRIRPATAGTGYSIREIDSNSASPCGTDGSRTSLAPHEDPGLERGTAKADDGSLIDVQVLYTTAARQALGSTRAMNAYVQLAIDVTNDAYALSNVSHRLRLVGRVETAWVENGGMNTALTNLSTDGDGIMDEAHDLRNQNRADIVALVVVDDQLCGLAFVGGTSDDTLGFNVNDWACIDAAGGWTLTHEIGHNMGAGHDAASPDNPLYDYAMGHALTGNTGNWRTIMVRRSVVGTRIGRFSNPNVLFDGAATGIATNLNNAAHNQLAFANTDALVAQWRSSLPSTVWVDYDYVGQEFGTQGWPYNTLAEAMQRVVYGGTILVVGGGITTETTTLGVDKPVFVRATTP